MSRAHLVGRGDVLSRYHEDVGWRLGVDVAKREDILGLEDDVAVEVVRSDSAKQAVPGHA